LGGVWLSDVEHCRLLMAHPVVKALLDEAVAWYDAEQKRQIVSQCAPPRYVDGT